jgi:hypothetical protein
MGATEEAAMAQQDRVSQVIKLAYELAQTGKFDDATAVDQELVALGYNEETRSLKSPDLRIVIDEVCATGRERDIRGWHTHVAW